jgi:drug/metabolite transporter (DMT)-like permease
VRWNLAMAGLAASWGFIAVLVAAVELPALTLAFARLALGAATIALIALVAGRSADLWPQGRLPALAFLGALQGAHWLLFFLAVKQGSVALAVLTFFTAPLLIALAAPLVLREPLANVTIGALLPAGAGIALITFSGSHDGGTVSIWALAAGLGSAATYAGLVLSSKRLLRQQVEPVTVAFWECLVGGVAVAPFLVLAPRVLPQDAGEWLAVLALGVVFTGISTTVYAWLLRQVTAQAAGLLTFLEPVAAVALAALLVDEPLSTGTVVGAVLVLFAGIGIVTLEPSDAAVDVAAAGAERQ